MSTKKQFTVVYILKSYQLFSIFTLGVVSGMPFAILATSLVAWLSESEVKLEIITTFAIARISYSLKPLWSPIVDHYSAPIFSIFGHRKSWLILCSLLTSLILLLMSIISAKESLSLLYFLAICLGAVSATFDISCDAFRIEKLAQEMQGLGAACIVFGYRIGILITGAGALYLSHITNSWHVTFLVMSVIFLIAALFVAIMKEQPRSIDQNDKRLNLAIIIRPFADFLARQGSIIILLAIIFFKLGDTMLGVVSLPFYLELGFSKEQIALVVKIYGFIATILGTYAGGFVVYALGHFRGLILTAIAQSVTNLAFVWLNHQGADFNALLIAISIENFAAGMGSAALVAYLSMLCNKKYSATQYALLSSASSLFNNTVTIYGGLLVKQLGWDNFFIFTVILGIPGILLLLYLHKTQHHEYRF